MLDDEAAHKELSVGVTDTIEGTCAERFAPAKIITKLEIITKLIFFSIVQSSRPGV